MIKVKRFLPVVVVVVVVFVVVVVVCDNGTYMYRNYIWEVITSMHGYHMRWTTFALWRVQKRL